MKSVGIIGFGSFGQFLAEKLDPYVDVTVFSYSGKANKWAASLETVVASDFLILAIPLDAYEHTLDEIRDKLSPSTVVVDVCSVKEQPLQIIKRMLPNQPMVATHPLFGPESAKDSLVGQTLVLCPEGSDEAALKSIEQAAIKLGLKVVKMSANEHDREMATVHGLTFFIAHALKDLKLHEQKLSTPTFEKLLQLANVERHHSQELFYTIQAGNAQTDEVRKRFIELCKKLDATI